MEIVTVPLWLALTSQWILTPLTTKHWKNTVGKIHSDFGIDGLALSWLHSYLSYRSQCVKLGDHTSSSAALLVRVSQGSVLGPLSSWPIPHLCPISLRTSTCLFTNMWMTRAFIPFSPTTVSPINLIICASAQMPLMTGILSIFPTQPTETQNHGCTRNHLLAHPHT